MTAFDNAWTFLKALPEQQMFREARRRTNASDDPYFPYWKYGASSETDPPIIDEHGARSYGTVHPAIASLLARRKDTERPVNLNLDAGKEYDESVENLRQSQSMAKIGKLYPHLIGASIASDPQTNMQSYDNMEEYKRQQFGYPSRLGRRM